MATIQVTFTLDNDSDSVDLDHATGMSNAGFEALSDALGMIDGFSGIYDGPDLVAGV